MSEGYKTLAKFLMICKRIMNGAEYRIGLNEVLENIAKI